MTTLLPPGLSPGDTFDQLSLFLQTLFGGKSPKIRYSTTTIGTGAAGVNAFTITHGIGSTPVAVVCTPRNGNNTDTFSCTVKSVSTTNFVVNVYRTDTIGAAWGVSIALDWIAVG